VLLETLAGEDLRVVLEDTSSVGRRGAKRAIR
jgi:hypothetical protein